MKLGAFIGVLSALIVLLVLYPSDLAASIVTMIFLAVPLGVFLGVPFLVLLYLIHFWHREKRRKD